MKNSFKRPILYGLSVFATVYLGGLISSTILGSTVLAVMIYCFLGVLVAEYIINKQDMLK